MRVGLLTREYPPEVYGGAGVHVEHLARELAASVDVAVHCFGEPRSSPLVAATYLPWAELAGTGDPSAAALQAMSVDLAMASRLRDVDVVHSHTWYANLAGHLAHLLWKVPHVCTVHSLEPLRPWKAEQLGGGYALSLFCERTALEAADAVIAVSGPMRDDVLRCYPSVAPERVHVIHNGVDAQAYRPDPGTDALERLGIDPRRPAVVFLGRITRQKGLVHLLDAAPSIDPSAQLVLLAGAPDTPEIAAEVRRAYEALRETRDAVLWIEQMLPRHEVVQVLSHAAVFVCPSVYEPFGMVNLEAMACEAPVVATALGGIPEVVDDGVTGLLVPSAVRPDDPDPAASARLAGDLASAINALLSDPAHARAMGRAGRRRVLERFTWTAVAARTVELYRTLAAVVG